ncbi:hypothetical protein GF369_02480 [Candidatus Peregrinibacteria bacterium]|nr:hypothetical protein [Candidatus Peregrinibacteria bacterium]
MKTKIANSISTLIEWLIYLSVFLIPVVFLPQVASVFTTPKLYVFRVVTLLIVFLWAVRFLLYKKTPFRWSPVFFFVIAYGLVSVLNTIVTVNVWTSLLGIYGRFVGLITVSNLLLWMYIVFNEINTRRKIMNVLAVSIATALLIALYGVLQYFDVLVNIFYWTQDPLERAFGTIGHSNHTAAYLGMNLVILLGLVHLPRFAWKRIMCWIGVGLLSIALILTASRGGIAAVVIALVLWVIYVFYTTDIKKKIRTYGKIILSVLLLLFIGGLVWKTSLTSLPIVERSVSTVRYIQQGNMPDRVSWWLSTIEMIQDKPLLGHGLSTYRDVYNQYRRVDYRTPNDAQDTITPHSAHNEYLTIAAAQGIVGLLLYVMMIGSVMVYGYRALRRMKKKEDRLLLYSTGMGICVYLAQVMVSFGVVSTLFVFFTFMGLLVSMSRIDRDSITISLPLWSRIIVSLIVFLLVIAGCIGSFFSLAGEYHYQQAQSNFAKRNMEQVFEHYDAALWFMPKMAHYYERYGDFLFKLGISMPEGTQEPYLHDAIEKYNISLLINNNLPHVHLNRGLVYTRLAEEVSYRDEELADLFRNVAIESFENAVQRTRNNPFYRYKLAQTLEYYERHAQAAEEYFALLDIRDPYRDVAEKINALEEKLGSFADE